MTKRAPSGVFALATTSRVIRRRCTIQEVVAKLDFCTLPALRGAGELLDDRPPQKWREF